MRCPDLSQLPPPPQGRKGWPWTEESPALPDVAPGGATWPAFSIVTPSFNQAEFLEETIRSILLQGYPNLEYFVIDGGSTDGSLEIIQKYSPWIAYWTSEPDDGQTDALNKGFARATGDIAAWLNSDDTYQPGALNRAGQEFVQADSLAVINGNCQYVDENSRPTVFIRTPRVTLDSLIRYWRRNALVAQPGVFFRRNLLDEFGLLETELDYVMDYDLWLRIAQKYQFHRVEYLFANYRLHGDSKTYQGWEAFAPEFLTVSQRYWGSRNSLRYWIYAFDRWGHLAIGTRWRRCLNWFRSKMFGAGSNGG